MVAPVLPDGVVAALRATPYLSRFPASLDPSPFPDTRRYAEPAPPASSRSFVYATFGSVAGGLGVAPYRPLLDAVDGLDVRVLLTTGAARVVEPPELRAAIAHPPPPLALARELRAAPPPLTALRRAL
jgi:UDP:flavonoid glycosyltransferase YjiC (YdhE family)